LPQRRIELPLPIEPQPDWRPLSAAALRPVAVALPPLAAGSQRLKNWRSHSSPPRLAERGDVLRHRHLPVQEFAPRGAE
jgi:hypothetical protein